MATTQIDTRTATDEQFTERAADAPDSPGTTSWTDRCGAPMMFDPASSAPMGEFETVAEERT